MKHPQTKFHVDTMKHSKIIRSKKSQNLSLGKNLLLGQNFLAAELFSRYWYFIKVNRTNFVCFCKFSGNSKILMVLVRLLTQQCCLAHYWTI